MSCVTDNPVHIAPRLYVIVITRERTVILFSVACLYMLELSKAFVQTVHVWYRQVHFQNGRMKFKVRL